MTFLSSRCPSCQSANLRPSRRRASDPPYARLFMRAYRCRDCRKRTWRLSGVRTGATAILLLSVATVTVIALRRHPTAARFIASTPEPAVSKMVAEKASPANKTSVAGIQSVASAGDRNAQFTLARMYREGDGVDRDDTLATHWLQEASKRDHPAAQMALARIYLDGTAGSNRDVDTAARWLDRAAHLGNAEAQYELATLLREGVAVKRDPIRAYVWYALSARGGYTPAVAVEGGVGASLASDQMSIAKDLLSRWQPGEFDQLRTDFLAAPK